MILVERLRGVESGELRVALSLKYELMESVVVDDSMVVSFEKIWWLIIPCVD